MSIKWEYNSEVVLIDVIPRVSLSNWIQIKYIATGNQHYILYKEYYKTKEATTHKR
jgi:hypothetical protein